MTTSPTPPSGLSRRQRKYIIGAIVGVLSLIVAPFIVEILKIRYGFWFAPTPVPPSPVTSSGGKTPEVKSPTVTRNSELQTDPGTSSSPGTTEPTDGEKATLTPEMLADFDKALSEKRFDDAQRILGDLANQFPDEKAIRNRGAELTKAPSPVPTYAGRLGDFAGTWDVYLDDSLVQQVTLQPDPEGPSGDYTAGSNSTGPDRYKLQGKMLVLSRLGSAGSVEQGIVAWESGDVFTYKRADQVYRYRRHK